MKYLSKIIFHSLKITAIVIVFGWGCGGGISIGFCADVKEIEIIVGGRKFESFEDYRLSRSRQEKGRFSALPTIPVKSFLTPFFALSQDVHTVNVRQWVNEFKRSQASEMVKVQVGQSYRGKSLQQLAQVVSAMSNVGFNTGVIRVINEFQKAGADVAVYKPLKANDLADVLSESFPEGGYSGPILIISSKNKLRILTLDLERPENTNK